MLETKQLFEGKGQVIHFTKADQGKFKLGINLITGKLNIDDILVNKDEGLISKEFNDRINLLNDTKIDKEFKAIISDVNAFLNLTKDYLDEIDEDLDICLLNQKE